jgi:short chain dehydrogenase
LTIHLDGAFLTTRAALRQMYTHRRGGSIIYMGSVHSKEASVLKAPYVTAKHGLIGLAQAVAKEGAAHECDAEGDGRRRVHHRPGRRPSGAVRRRVPSNALTGQSLVVRHGWFMQSRELRAPRRHLRPRRN